MACVRRSNDWQELVDQLEASVAAPSATPQTLLDAVAWNNTIHDPWWSMCYFVHIISGCKNVLLWWSRSLQCVETSPIVYCSNCSQYVTIALFFSEHFFPWQKTRQLWRGMGSFQPGAVVADLLRSRFASRSNEMTFLMLQIGRLQEVADHHGGEVWVWWPFKTFGQKHQSAKIDMSDMWYE